MKLGTNVETEYRAMMGLLGLDMKQINEIPAKFDMTPLFTKKVDVWSGYEVNEPIAPFNWKKPRHYSKKFEWPPSGIHLKM